MATTDALTGTITGKIEWSRAASLATGVELDATSRTFEQVFTAGTGANQIDRHFHTNILLAPSGSTTLDLTALVQQAFHGSSVSVSFARLKMLAIINDATTLGTDLHIDTSVAAGLLTPFDGSTTTLLRVAAGGAQLMADPLAAAWPVTGTTADILKFTNTDASNSLPFRIVLWGASA